MAKNETSFIGQIFGLTIKFIISGFLIIGMLMVGISVLSTGDPDMAEIRSSQFETLEGQDGSDNLLLNINVEGIILGTPPTAAPSNPFGLIGTQAATYGYYVKQRLQAAAKNDNIKGIFLHIASPGGTVFGSMAIHDAIEDYQTKTGNPVVAYVEGMSASGGVMAMVGADAIYADRGSLVGSIGVMGSQILYYDQPKAFDNGILGGGITTEGGIEQTIISAGRSKDLGNPFRRATADELATLQKGVNDLYTDFVNHVAKERQITPDIIRNTMGAQIFENRQAEDYGLIDGTRTWDKAIKELAKLAKIEKDYRLVRPQRPRISTLERFFMMNSESQHDDTLSAEDYERLMQADVCSAFLSQSMVYYGTPQVSCR